MRSVSDAVGYLGQSLVRTLELVLAVVVLLVTGFGLWLVLMEPGSSEGRGIVVFFVYVAAAASVLLAVTNILHAGFDAVQFATD